MKRTPRRPAHTPRTAHTGSACSVGTGMLLSTKTGVSPVTTRHTTSAETAARNEATKTTCVKLPFSSSRAKISPARGALNAAASPAAAPALMRALRSPSPCFTRNQVETMRPVAPPICTVGPSRPSARPPPMLAAPARNLTGMTRFQWRWRSPRTTDFRSGIPLPAVSGAKRLTSQRPSALPAAPSTSATKSPSAGVRSRSIAIRLVSRKWSATRKAEAIRPDTMPTTRALGRMWRRFTSDSLRPDWTSG